MDKRKIIPIRPDDPFTKKARERWDRIPKWAQDKILENVYCVGCRDVVTIVLESAVMEKGDLVLRGKCKICGHEVCRVVEPES
jgi:Domain of unknown function (DUF5679)